MQRTCRNPWCTQPFEVTAEDMAFLASVSPTFCGRKEVIPPPTLCPTCRTQRRLAWRNHHFVYRHTPHTPREADFSMWPPESPFPSYKTTEWFSDHWDQYASGQAVDLTQPFFPQFLTVHNCAPHFALDNFQMENSDYSNNADNSKNCYLCFNCSTSQDCIDCDNVVDCRSCIDCTRIFHCERCLNCIDCERSYELQESQGCENCTESAFLFNCRACTHCLGCVNLRHREYCIFNEQKTLEEYQNILQSLALESWEKRHTFGEQWRAFVLSQPCPHAILRHADGCTGNYLQHCSDVYESLFIHTGERLRHCQHLFNDTHDCHDVTLFGIHVGHCYESSIVGLRASLVHFCVSVWENTSDMLYCAFCVNCCNCFGCTGLYRKRYCILNRQYTKEEYEELVPQLIACMQSTEEWGEFFPIAGSPVPYNRSLAQIYYPLEREAALARGYSWYEEPPQEDAHAVTEHLDTLPTDDSSRVLRSIASDKCYKLTTPEIALYRSFGTPLPRTTYDERIAERSALLGGLTLFDRTCSKTGVPIRTTIPPTSPWIVWEKSVYDQEFQ